MSDVSFAHPWLLLLLLLLPFIWIHYKKVEDKIVRKLRVPSIGHSSLPPKSGRVKLRLLPVVLRILALVILIVALARPQQPLGSSPLSIDGIDIMLSLDISESMLAQDFKPDRLQAAIKEAKSFIDKRPNDRIGLVIFAGESFTQCPLTTDHRILNVFLDNIQVNYLESGTAIGMGLATAVHRLKDSEAKSKVIVLMTDGVNNTGYIDPQTAMKMAVSESIRVYTVGIGKSGSAPFPYTDPFSGRTVYKEMEVQIDEELLQNIADETQGECFRAQNNQELKDIYQSIDRLEKSKIKVSAYTPKKELYFPFILIGLLLLMLEWMVKAFYLKQDI
ncbi:MAG TPA: VWA domain-containing protein [Chitinophagales bacterium]|nr:VWA domain-containing protein [Chitinophagales bacterium]